VPATLPAEVRDAVRTLWDNHQLGHEPHQADVGVGLGSHDLGVATCAADLYHRGLVPRLVFTGANAPTTIGVFPRGEAVHYREHALALGVPDDAILVEPTATNTGESITRTRTPGEAEPRRGRRRPGAVRGSSRRGCSDDRCGPGTRILTASRPVALCRRYGFPCFCGPVTTEHRAA